MNYPEEKACSAHASIFNAVSQLSLVLLLTLPLSLYSLLAGYRRPLPFSLAILLFVSGLLLAARAWHIQLDARILKAISQGMFELQHSDKVLHGLFNKRADESKTLQNRFDGGYRLIRSFFLLLGAHLALLLALLAVGYIY